MVCDFVSTGSPSSRPSELPSCDRHGLDSRRGWATPVSPSSRMSRPEAFDAPLVSRCTRWQSGWPSIGGRSPRTVARVLGQRREERRRTYTGDYTSISDRATALRLTTGSQAPSAGVSIEPWTAAAGAMSSPTGQRTGRRSGRRVESQASRAEVSRVRAVRFGLGQVVALRKAREAPVRVTAPSTTTTASVFPSWDQS